MPTALGRAAATHWLKAHRAAVGVRSSLNIEETFLRPPRRAPGSGL